MRRDAFYSRVQVRVYEHERSALEPVQQPKTIGFGRFFDRFSKPFLMQKPVLPENSENLASQAHCHALHLVLLHNRSGLNKLYGSVIFNIEIKKGKFLKFKSSVIFSE